MPPIQHLTGSRQVYLGCLLLAIAVAAVYGRSLGAPFIFDDHINIVQNEDLRSWDGLGGKLFYKSPVHLPDRNTPTRPVLFLTFTANYAWSGLDPYSYRFVNIAIHIANSILFFLLIRVILIHQGRADALGLSLAAAALFALHPINTEAVTYVSNRSDSLATLFYLASLLLFFKPSPMGITASLASFTLSFGTKEIAATLPAVLLALDYFLISGGNIKAVGRRKWAHASFWVFLALLFAFRYFYVGQAAFGGGGIEKSWTPFSYLLTQVFVTLRYFGLLIAPIGQSIDHWIKPIRSTADLRFLLSSGTWAAMAAAFYFMVRKMEGPERRLAFFSAAWFFLTLAPTSSILPIYDPMVERRLYLPSVGFFLAMTLACGRLWQKPQALKRPAILFFCLYLFWNGFMTWRRNGLYNDPALMWREAISRFDRNDRAFNNLGHVLMLRGDYAGARDAFKTAVDLNPALGGAHFNLASASAAMDDNAAAAEHFARSIELDPKRVQAYLDLSEIYFEEGRFEDAIALCRKGLREEIPAKDRFSLLNNLGIFLAQSHQYDAAEKAFTDAVELYPDAPQASRNLAHLRSQRPPRGK